MSNTHSLLNKMLLSLSATFSVCCHASFAFFNGRVFSLLGHSLLQKLLKFKTSQVIICAVNTFVFWFKNGLLQVNHS